MILLSPTPILTTERLTLRAPKGSDWPAWRAFMASDRLRFVRPDDFDDAASWRAFGHAIGHWAMRGWGMFVFTARDDDTPLGMAGPWFPEGWPEREIGWSLWPPEAEGKGLAAEAAGAARAHAFGALGWTTAVSYVDPGNARSIALAERMGAIRDDAAPVPHSDRPCLVYRHSAAHAKGAA
ncbi:GNAT family N-acetyltransferase [Paracoccus stylophorae]|uniref:GNAT family N-acetyltransferase n=1 Tax=Paracoccus stylophorae TaxID=659350 RepID=A0ABY7SXB5_9RHOB|nr:GNAT family N-acetyltransferase [Paracoccus stylophorae]WCR11672.1 GNAT family N-acetyltransferase [Paracoccus stylophorae]